VGYELTLKSPIAAAVLEIPTFALFTDLEGVL
jgi:hypothetical protein